MKQTEQATVTVKFEMWHAQRIETQFRNNIHERDIAHLFQYAIQDGFQKHKQTASDEAKIPVTIQLTLKQARTIVADFKLYAGFPSDGEVYLRVKNAIEKSEE